MGSFIYIYIYIYYKKEKKAENQYPLSIDIIYIYIYKRMRNAFPPILKRKKEKNPNWFVKAQYSVVAPQ